MLSIGDIWKTTALPREEQRRGPPYRVESNGVGETLVLSQFDWTTGAYFCTIWLAFWTIGIIAVFIAVVGAAVVVGSHPSMAFIALWILVASFFWYLGFSIVAWVFGGAEIIRVVDGNLLVGYRVLGFERLRCYASDRVRGLQTVPNCRYSYEIMPQAPWLGSLERPNAGAIVFQYDKQTVRVGLDLHQSDAEAILEHLRKSMPSTANAAA